MTFHHIITRIMGLFLLSATLGAHATEGGVSLSLARSRASMVSQITYQLHFRLPASTAEPVTGQADIQFALTDTRGDVLLDFCGQALPPTLTVNGRRRPTLWSDEHVTLKGGWLHRGDNRVSIAFTSADKSLNRHADYLYTLFVPANARSVFPCFDQPDLKGRFQLHLDLPEGWTSLTSDSTRVLPTYLCSFVAGRFQRRTVERDGRQLTALYRESDPKKVAQLDKCFDEAALSLRWLEHYTGLPCPFTSYGFVVLPGYQFGGMEHPGAIQFNDREIFLGDHPTPDEELTRLELIAHETTHLWFGDLVTMRWFNDVWTKEVFANFLAQKIAREEFPDINHELNFLKAYQLPALATDRTAGTHPIQQPLDNLRDAGLLYGSIIYDKAPVMMRKLEQLMGPDAFRRGLTAYLRRFAYANATWDDLIHELDSVAPQAHVEQFSQLWVKEKGLPTFTFRYADGQVEVAQTDPDGHGRVWPQQLQIAAEGRGAQAVLTDEVEAAVEKLPCPVEPSYLIPNYDGSGYGRFLLDGPQTDSLMAHLTALPDLNRMAALMTLYENFLAHRIAADRYAAFLQEALNAERNPLIASTIASELATAKWYTPRTLRSPIDRYQWLAAHQHPLASLRLQVLRSLGRTVVDPAITDSVYTLWLQHADTTLTERDYTATAYHLALLRPAESDAILARQRARLKTDDERREFDFIARACTPDSAQQRQLFLSLIPKEGRGVEPWARQALALLSDESREAQANGYILQGLDSLQYIQRTSDIFFPGYWVGALLGDHHSEEAQHIVREWIDRHPDYPTTLMNKVKQQAFHLLNLRH
jgi:aminopeptidase N